MLCNVHDRTVRSVDKRQGAVHAGETDSTASQSPLGAWPCTVLPACPPLREAPRVGVTEVSLSQAREGHEQQCVCWHFYRKGYVRPGLQKHNSVFDKVREGSNQRVFSPSPGQKLEVLHWFCPPVQTAAKQKASLHPHGDTNQRQWPSDPKGMECSSHRKTWISHWRTWTARQSPCLTTEELQHADAPPSARNDSTCRRLF